MVDEQMIELGKRVKARREELGYTQLKLAELSGYTSDSIITKIEKGEADPPRPKIIALANALLVNPSYLMGWSEKELDYSSIPGIIPLHKARRIPILGTIACGDPIWADENYEGYFVADTSIKADFCLRAKGDSMIDADIQNGDLIFLKKASDADNGKIVAVLLDNEATLKKIYKTDDSIILQPCNTKYAPKIIHEKDYDSVLILGEAVGKYTTNMT